MHQSSAIQQNDNGIQAPLQSQPFTTAQHDEINEHHAKSQEAPPYSEKPQGQHEHGPTQEKGQAQGGPTQHYDTPVAATVPLSALGEDPAWIVCPFCEYRVRTRVMKDNSEKTQRCGLILCLLAGLLFAFLPCICGWYQDVTHYCDHCGQKVVYKPYEGNVVTLNPTNAEALNKSGKAGGFGATVQTGRPSHAATSVPHNTDQTVHSEVTQAGVKS